MPIININTQIESNTQSLQASLSSNTQSLQASLSSNKQNFNVDMTSGIIYTISPTAKVEQLSNGNYLITITDKNGTTTAEIPSMSQQTIDYFMNQFFLRNPIVQNAIEEHNLSKQSHLDIRELLTQVVLEDDILILDAGNAETEY